MVSRRSLPRPPIIGRTPFRLYIRCHPERNFRFHIDFANLAEDELSLLLYCLTLEEDVTVTLSPAALGPDFHDSATFQGPLRHKLGYAKSLGGGSVRVRPTRMELRSDPRARYRGTTAGSEIWEGKRLAAEIRKRTVVYRGRTKDATTADLRAVLIYSPDDPRRAIRYPSNQWFKDNHDRPLKPTR